MNSDIEHACRKVKADYEKALASFADHPEHERHQLAYIALCRDAATDVHELEVRAIPERRLYQIIGLLREAKNSLKSASPGYRPFNRAAKCLREAAEHIEKGNDEAGDELNRLRRR